MITKRQAHAVLTLRQCGFNPNDQIILDKDFCSTLPEAEREEIIKAVQCLIRARLILPDTHAGFDGAYRLANDLFDRYVDWYHRAALA
jgi:hypothetical protein